MFLGAQTSIHCAIADEIPDENRIYYRYIFNLEKNKIASFNVNLI